MNLFDLLTKKNNVIDYTQNMPPLKAQPQIDTIQVDENGAPIQGVEIQPEKNVTVADKLENRTNNFGNKLTNALFGISSQPTDNINTNGELISATVSENPRTGGIFRDIVGGYKENRNNPISLSNLEPNKNKNIAYRLGEGLGSIARFGESPLGRGIATAGAIGLTGGNLDDVLAYGINTVAKNQLNRANNKLYRDDLYETRKQALMNDPKFTELSDAEKQQMLNELHTDKNYMDLTSEEAKGLNGQQYHDKLAEKQSNMKQRMFDNYVTNRQQQQLNDLRTGIDNYRGYLTGDTYGNLINTQQLRDNAAWRKMYYDQNQANLREQMEFRRQQALADQAYKQMMLEFQKQKEASDRAYQDAQLGLGYARLGSDNENRRLDREEKAKDRESKNQNNFEKANKGSIDIINQIGTIRRMLKQNPNAVGIAKGNTPGWLINRMDTKGVEVRTAIDDLRTYIRHELTGAQFSPAEAREYERFLPTTKDTPSIINAKLNALENKLNAKIYGQSKTKRSGLAF